jgi:maltose O-acetyltransferase
MSIFTKYKKKLAVLIRSEVNDILKEKENAKLKSYNLKYDFDTSVKFGRIDDVYLSGPNIEIGNNTYFNSGIIQSGSSSMIKIGSWCAIGYNVNIIAITHDTDNPTGPADQREVIEKDITIGDHCWIGSNVFIKEGISIGDNVIIGANSVVVTDIPDKAIYGGVPAKLIRQK